MRELEENNLDLKKTNEGLKQESENKNFYSTIS